MVSSCIILPFLFEYSAIIVPDESVVSAEESWREILRLSKIRIDIATPSHRNSHVLSMLKALWIILWERYMYYGAETRSSVFPIGFEVCAQQDKRDVFSSVFIFQQQIFIILNEILSTVRQNCFNFFFPPGL